MTAYGMLSDYSVSSNKLNNKTKTNKKQRNKYEKNKNPNKPKAMQNLKTPNTNVYFDVLTL
jgi:hypothetical protein